MKSLLYALLLGSPLLTSVYAQTSHPEVLVVYNSDVPDSLTVARHYIQQRNVPEGNLCAIAPPAADYLSLNEYVATVKTPVQNCLTNLGAKSILYIVMSYMTPFVVGTGPFGKSSIDSYMGDIWDKVVTEPFLVVPSLQPYYADSQSMGNAYSPFQSLAAYRTNPGNPLIYSVWRLDGPTAAIASALVDQAIQAEAAGGPSGQGCIDRNRGDLANFVDAGYLAGDFDLHQAATFLQQAGIAVTEDPNEAEFGTAPAPLTCPNTAFYSGWYSFNHYNDAFAWQTGSIGWHLDSASALNPRSGDSWAPNALLRGLAVTSGSVTEPYLEGLVRPGGTFRNLLEGANVGDAFLRNTRWLKWQILYIGDPLYKPFGAGRAPFQPLQPVNSLMISPQESVGGGNSTGTITLAAAAPDGGVTFRLSAPKGITVPSTVTVPTGSNTATFAIGTDPVNGSNSLGGIVLAASDSVTLKNTIVSDPLLSQFLPGASTTIGGTQVEITVLLNGPAPSGGVTIALASDNAAVTVPPSITVPADLNSATFSVNASAVSAPVTATITGTYAGATQGFTITVVPGLTSISATPSSINASGTTLLELYLGANVPDGQTAIVQLTSSDPGSLSVPASITIPAGSHYGNAVASASAGASGKTITITATYGGASKQVTVTVGTPGLTSLSASPSSINASGTTLLELYLGANVPDGQTAIVQLTSSDPGSLSVPASVTIPAGAHYGNAQATASAAASSATITITATYGGASKQVTVTVGTPGLTSLSATPSSINASGTTLLELYLAENVPDGQTASVQLTSSDPGSLSVPASITIPAGSHYGNAVASASAGASGKTVMITATYGGASKQVTVTVGTPGLTALYASPSTINASGTTILELFLAENVPDGQTASVELTSSDPSSLPVPASITVPAGTHYGNAAVSASAGSSGKTVTVTATYGGTSKQVTVTIN